MRPQKTRKSTVKLVGLSEEIPRKDKGRIVEGKGPQQREIKESHE